MTIVDLLGYCASAFVLLSFLMREMRNLRLMNLVGCTFFIIYGFMIDQWPIIITNVAIVFVNLWYLFFKKEKV